MLRDVYKRQLKAWGMVRSSHGLLKIVSLLKIGRLDFPATLKLME